MDVLLMLWFSGCYGIVEVPEGEWYCAKCADFIAHSQYNGNSGDVGEVRETPRCKLCPFGHGALKRTDNDGQCCSILDPVIFKCVTHWVNTTNKWCYHYDSFRRVFGTSSLAFPSFSSSAEAISC